MQQLQKDAKMLQRGAGVAVVSSLFLAPLEACTGDSTEREIDVEIDDFLIVPS